MNTLRILFSAFLLVIGWYLGTLYGEGKEIHLCATHSQFQSELIIDSTLALKSLQYNEIITTFDRGELNNLLNDPGLIFHACKK